MNARLRFVQLALPLDTESESRRPAATHPDDKRDAEHLTAWHCQYNATYFGGALRPLAVRVSRRMRTLLGQYTVGTRGGRGDIAISRRHLRRHGWTEALQTLLHEMVHQWQDENGLPIDHGSNFRAKAREIGIPPFARRTFAA